MKGLFQTLVIAAAATVASAGIFLDYPHSRHRGDNFNLRLNDFDSFANEFNECFNHDFGRENDFDVQNIQVNSDDDFEFRWRVDDRRRFDDNNNARIALQYAGDNQVIILADNIDINSGRHNVRFPGGRGGDAILQFFFESEEDRGFYMDCSDIVILIDNNNRNNRNRDNRFDRNRDFRNNRFDRNRDFRNNRFDRNRDFRNNFDRNNFFDHDNNRFDNNDFNFNTNFLGNNDNNIDNDVDIIDNNVDNNIDNNNGEFDLEALNINFDQLIKDLQDAASSLKDAISSTDSADVAAATVDEESSTTDSESPSPTS